MHSKVFTAAFSLAALALTGCAGMLGSDSIPSELQPAGGEHVQSVLHATGVQIYECRPSATDSSKAEWAFVAPEADLFDSTGRPVGKHYAGPNWESADGSKVVGKVAAKADAPQSGAVAWLLLTTQSVGGPGTFSNVTAIQRVNTVGGATPNGSGCTPAQAGLKARVPYRADYRMLAK
jgi:uncharacterized protein DUF3455